ncbi:MAG: 23S rRNA (uracil(1939)-C(5))-methyltransferase RlmD [Bacteroidetes bacterium]|nr:23S rRNA (uracil(1939)-C(5))-methyltransferase RlmD [Bacteroidota bacterium]MBS1631169.1 23S rRNA (uracil(1939)-C(5))-methyltransferase RlmD [Bacteroidota bacterium]
MRRKKRDLVLEKILVEDYAAEGRSLARVDGKVIFIERVVPGDVVDVKIYKNKKDWAEGWPLNFHSFSKDRVTPFCSHFGICGGCQWQMLPYEKQLLYKQRQVMDNLQRIGKISLPEPLSIIGADDTMYYRNKLEYTFGNRRFLLPEELKDSNISPDENVAGFHAPGIFDKVVDIDTCYLQAEPNNAIRKAVKKFALDNGMEFYDIRGHHGFLRTMQLRICTTGEVMVNIVFGKEDDANQKKLLDHLLNQFPSITTLLYTINPKMNDSINDLEPVIYYGNGYVTEKLENFSFRIGPKSFFQTNTRQAEKLYRVVRDFAALSGKETVYDLYCGTGSIGIFLSPGARKIIGVDLIEAAIEDARQNAVLNRLNNTDFYAGDVIDICNDEFFNLHGTPDVIITDPPRAGMHERLVKKILEVAAPVVIYVSCNPATQGRDLNLLGEKYEVTKIQPVDMFPHTHHIENVVQLKAKS